VTSTRTNREIEIKLPVADLAALIRHLQRLGAVSLGRVFEKNTLYDTPESDLRRGGSLLRLRVETPAGSTFVLPGLPSAVLTFKAPPASALLGGGRAVVRSRYKERLERELTIPQPSRWNQILTSLGFRPGFCYSKYRTSFRLPGLHVDLDETPVGTFLELEGIPKAIERVAGVLGYTRRDYLQATYWELYAADCKCKGRVPGNMVFDT
jgi:adenylate cyclase class IV